MARLQALSGGTYDANIAGMCDMGMVETKNGQLRVTAKGRPLLNAVLSELLRD